MLTTLEKAKALKEFRGLRVALTSGALKTLEKAKSLKRFRELRVLLGGDALIALGGDVVPVEQPKDYTPLLNGIINGDINVFTDQDKISELEQIEKDYANKELAVTAIVEAARQVIVGYGKELE